MDLWTKLKSIVKIGVTKNTLKDKADNPFVQTEYMGKLNDVWYLTPYGLYSSPPVGSLGIVFNIRAEEQNRAGIFNVQQRRFKDLKEGEVVLGNVLTGTRVILKANGDCEVFVAGDRNVTIEGNDTVTVNGGLLEANVDEFRINGQLRVRDDICWNFGTVERCLNNFREIYNRHVHPENDSGGPTDEPIAGDQLP